MTTAAISPVLVWIRGMRAPFFTAAVVPVLVGGAAAFYQSGSFHWGYFLLTLLGMVSLHAAANLINDYFDYRSGCDPDNPARTLFNGGSNVIAEGLLSERAMRNAALVAYGIGAACGLFLAWRAGPRGWVIVLLGLLGMAISYAYTQPRLFLAGRGLGEIGVGLSFGVLSVLGTYFVQTGSFSWCAFWASLPVTGLIINVLWINQFPDLPVDHAVGKDNLVVRLGKKRARYGYHVLTATIYLSIVVGVLLRALPAWSLLALLALPLALRAARTLHLQYEQNAALLPAQATTIQVHLLTGLLLSLGLLLAGL
ncbi:MAG: 1,4-dihydroxy-2-naphthoate octaprenyltransferase [Chloroflexia bacterium]|nr:1,4-dihydroxy-2-naphthoate octaprenyltransferase [Chloroflexia bacterium]